MVQLLQDILRIQGPAAVQQYLVNEIQEVYRLQGEKSTTNTLK
jgi:DNA-directed RNA polymerase subunit beta'